MSMKNDTGLFPGIWKRMKYSVQRTINWFFAASSTVPVDPTLCQTVFRERPYSVYCQGRNNNKAVRRAEADLNNARRMGVRVTSPVK